MCTGWMGLEKRMYLKCLCNLREILTKDKDAQKDVQMALKSCKFVLNIQSFGENI